MSAQTEASKASAQSNARTRRTWFGFIVMCVGMFMAILDVQIVATSLPSIQSALAIDPDQMSWIQTAYLIAEVIAIPLTGLLTRALSLRWLFVGAVVIFTLASIGCASSDSFASLVAWRVLQGFSGGTLIPAVFSAVFIFFPAARQPLATTIAGVLAVLAPTVGPIAGGWITQTYSWHWLFLINAAPGALCAALGAFALPKEPTRIASFARLDAFALAALAVGLGALEIALKEGPINGWTSAAILLAFALTIAALATFVRRSLNSAEPIVELRIFADRRFAIGCALSFTLGIGLFGSVYLMPVYLAFVRAHNALQIGAIMLVTGVSQLLAAPIAVALETRVAPRLLTAFGFGLFALGLALSGWQNPRSDFQDMLVPQMLRGAAIMFCLLPPTRLALGHLDSAALPNASGLFNLMRNLGGAIGIALIDTIIFVRPEALAATLMQNLQRGDVAAAAFVGVAAADVAAAPNSPASAALRSAVETAALVQAIDEAWIVVALLTAAAMLALPFVYARPQAALPAARPTFAES